MRINNNIMAMNTYRQLGAANGATSKAMEKLSSGLRINRAGDDAAGLSISEKMRAQIRGLNQASRNAQDGISLIQTAEGALNETQAILQRMRELVVQAGNGTNDGDDLTAIQNEIEALIEEIGGTSTVSSPGGSATPAKVSSGDVSGLLSSDLSSTADLTLNGQTVQLTEVKKLDGTTTPITMDALMNALQADINAVFDGTSGVTFTVGVEGNTLTIETDATGSSATIEIGSGAPFNFPETIENGEDAPVASAEGSKGISDRTQFNGKALLDGDFDVTFQIGANQGQQVTLSIRDMSASGLGVNSIDVTDFEGASFDDQLGAIDNAIKEVSAERSKLGAMQNRLEHTIKNVDNAAENLQAAESRIRDVDMAKEMMEFTKNSILQQAATAMLAQANQAPQGVLQLLR
jgi:flagellin